MKLSGVEPWLRLALQLHVDDATGCWNFCGTLVGVKAENKYSSFDYDSKSIAAHRASWIIHNGDPGESCVLHDCDNRRCCNPGHLYLGDKKQNRADFMARHPRARELVAIGQRAGAAGSKRMWDRMSSEERSAFTKRRGAIQEAKLLARGEKHVANVKMARRNGVKIFWETYGLLLKFQQENL